MDAFDIVSNLQGLPELEFRSLASFNGGAVGVYWALTGVSPWERHPDEDELLQVIEGDVDIEILTANGRESTHLAEGSILVVPRGHWHRHRVSHLVKELYVTPGRTETSHSSDPRDEQSPSSDS